MNQVKGSLIKSRLTYIEKYGTPVQKEEILNLLSAVQKEKISPTILPSAWYDIDIFIDLNLAMDKILGTHDKSLIPKIAAFCAEDALNGIYKLFYKVGSPEFIIKRAAGVWKQFYSSGSVTVTIKESKQANFQVSNYADITEVHCIIVQGWIAKTLELSGAKNLQLSYQQNSDGVVFTGIWT